MPNSWEVNCANGYDQPAFQYICGIMRGNMLRRVKDALMKDIVYGEAELFFAQNKRDIPLARDMPTRTEPRMQARAVIFDLFGTLVRTHDVAQDERAPIVKRVAKCVGVNMDDADALNLLRLYRANVDRLKEQSRQTAGVHGEISVADAWERALAQADKPVARCDAEGFAFLYSLYATRPYPMPGMQELIGQLHGQGLPLGIISNAQPFTMQIVNRFLEGTCTGDAAKRLFVPELCSFSFEQKLIKPDARLFKKVTRALELRGIAPHECLYVGNDMYRDMYPAQKAGFRTVLFVGDRESLRLRADHKSTAGLRPDYIISSLGQLSDCIAIG